METQTIILIDSYLPVFNGFYGTYFEYSNEEFDIENYNTENETDLDWSDFDWDYKDYRNRISTECVSEIYNYLKLDHFDIEIEFQKLLSPREYNFRTDEILVGYVVPIEDFNRLREYLKIYLEEFTEYLKKRYSSYSGFVSFFSTDPLKWLNNYLLDEKKRQHCFGSILDFYFLNEGYKHDDLAEAVSSERYINFKVIG